MIYDDIEFFNVEEINKQGNILRFKEDLIQSLGNSAHTRGRFYGYRAIGVELRFVMNSSFFDLKLRSDKEESKVYVFFGDYMGQAYTLKEGVITNLHIEIPEKFLKYRDVIKEYTYHPRMVRIVIGYSGYVSYIGLNTYGNRRPPLKEELPRKSLLLYGSSISHGSEALEYINSYAFILSRLLKMNVINKSIPGSCQAEEIMCKYLKEIPCDVAFTEFGVNVLGLYSLEDYQKHLDMLLNSFQTKQVYFTSVLDNGNLLEPESLAYKRMMDFRAYAESIRKHTYIPPQELLDDFSSLTADFLHPSDYGQMQIALNFYHRLKEKN
ncbi:MAG: hypothetical protein K2M84_05690 [Anaeroplasmataceae bacterium]|nr:hypothetical protein [Anaeroplasmataceae bacterium]